MRTLHPSPLVASLLASMALPLAGLAQCPNTWQVLPGCPGANLPVGALANYDPDGVGPLPMQVVLAGAFQQVGTTATEGLALWNPTTGTFADLSDPSPTFPGELLRGPLAVRGTDLYVATFAPAILRSRIHRFDGASWTALGGDFDGVVHAMCTRANGDLVVGGNFNLAGSTALPGFASWDGTNWNAVPGFSGAIFAIDELANGDLLVGGQTNLGGVARLAGTTMTWSAVGSNAPFQALAVAGLPNGDVVVADGTSVHRFDGTQWTQVPMSPAALQHQPARLLRTSGGALVVGGVWIGSASGTSQVAHAVQFDVATGQWTPLGLADNLAFFDSVNAMLEAPNGDLLLGGALFRVGGVDLANLARFDGTTWHALADGPTNYCLAGVALGGDQFVVGGGFRSFGNLPLRSVAHWTGSAWAPLGTGLDGVVHDLVRLPDGSLIAGGEFQSAGGVQARGLARWDGVAWSEFGGVTGAAFPAGAVYRLLPLANGDLMIGGNFQSIAGVPCNSLARWNGTSFQPVPGFVPVQSIHHLGELPSGDLVVADSSRVYQQWFGSWTWVGITGPGTWVGPTNYIASLRVLRNGFVAIGAYDASSNPVLHLLAPGSAGFWQLALDGDPSELYELPDGDLLVTGFFTSIGGVAADGAARIGSFLPLVVSPAGFDGRGVFTLAPLANGDLLALGSMTSLGGAPAYGVAKLEPGCRPLAAGYGSGCPGSAGPNVLAATSLPWLGDTFTMRASGLPANSLALAMVGLQLQSIPLPLATPLGTPGCDLLTTIDLESLQPTGNGTLDLELRIPDAAFLIGYVLHAQVAPLDVDAFGLPTGVTSTNALQLVIGDR